MPVFLFILAFTIFASPSARAQCSAGYIPSLSGLCTPCPPGTYSLDGASVCTLCPSGTFGDHAGLSTSACSGSCPSCSAGSIGTSASSLFSSTISSMSCSADEARNIPSNYGMQIWPAAHPLNPQALDLVLAPAALCAQMTPGGTCTTSPFNQLVGSDGINRFVVGTAAALNMEPSSSLQCTLPSPSSSPSPSVTPSSSSTMTRTATTSPLPSLTVSTATTWPSSQQLTGYSTITISAELSISGQVKISASSIVITDTGSIIGDGGGPPSDQGQGWPLSLPGCYTTAYFNGLGGSYGGCGGLSQLSSWGNGAPAGPNSCNWGNIYGNANAPMDMGTGGLACLSNPGGSGGAAIFLQAESITINGNISVAGGSGVSGRGNGHYEPGGGGSGGSIRIVATTLSPSSGRLSANGGTGGMAYAGGWGAGGGGGRISISASTWQLASSGLTASALGGMSTSFDGSAHDYGGEGSVTLRGGTNNQDFYTAPAAPPCATVTSSSLLAGRIWSVRGLC